MNDTFTTAEISGMLAKIPAPPPYQEWMRICSAVWSVLPMAEGCQVLQAWSPEKVEGEYATKHKARLQKVGIGTLVHLAQQNGWTSPEGRRRRPGKVLVASAPIAPPVWNSRTPRPSWMPAQRPLATPAPRLAPSPVLDPISDAEATRVGMQLARMHKAGLLSGPDDPEAVIYAQAFRLFRATLCPL